MVMRQSKYVDWLVEALAMFESDPPDTAFQRGYLEAIIQACDLGDIPVPDHIRAMTKATPITTLVDP